ncbi:MAG: tRNA (guanosine(46)-N7)-methyltransferase TrmB [Veillonellaceae bacterium]|nr:tRNA (guanosine(46)-N7)-methyltransferase TrmB [Veillonellaceae bacterium]
MRLRNKPWIDEAIREFADFLYTELPTACAGRWGDVFGRPTAPLWVELGTGKGQFIAGLAERHPEVNLVGLEVARGVIFYAGQKIAERGLPHVRLVEMDIAHMEEVFAPGEIDRLYLNFSDPWPKARHAKRRLTHHAFLARYATLLRAGGEVHMKTDNAGLFAFSKEEFVAAGWLLREVSEDLHAAEPEDNVRTEYETKFSAKGQPIYRLVAVAPAAGGNHA